jgi:hypothetical protein
VGEAGEPARTGCGAGERAQVQRSGRGGSGQRSRDCAGRKGTTLTCGVIGSARSERRRGRGAGLGRGKRSAQEGGGERRGAGARGPSWTER